MKVLVTRPEPDGERTARALHALGFEPVVIQLSAIVPCDPGPLPQSNDVIATSGHALASLPAAWRSPALLKRPIHVVGSRTAEAARNAGFQTILEGPGDAAGLLASILASRPNVSRFLYLAGEPRKPLVESELARAGFAVTTAVLYRNQTLARAPEALRAVLAASEPLAVLHFSKVSAESFARLAGSNTNAPLLQVCLSQDIASVLSGDVSVAEHPNEASLLQALQFRMR
jgi:uroporphyrinogen-III synthase